MFYFMFLLSFFSFFPVFTFSAQLLPDLGEAITPSAQAFTTGP